MYGPALPITTNTKIRLLTRMAFGFHSAEPLIALAMLTLGGYRPAIPGREGPTDQSGEPEHNMWCVGSDPQERLRVRDSSGRRRGLDVGEWPLGVTLEELIHVYDVRKVLEREAARLGAEPITPEGCARMEAEYGFMRAAIAEGRLEDHLRLDEALLTALYEASGNPVLVKTIQNLWVQCRAYKTVGIKVDL